MIESSSELVTSSKITDMSLDLLSNNLKLWTDLRLSINNRDITSFQVDMNQHPNFSKIASLKPRLINETLQDCIAQSSKIPITETSTEQGFADGCDFIEVLMNKLHKTQCYFVSWEETCKSIVRVYIDQRRQFSPITLCFLLRCYDLELLQLVFKYDLVDIVCYGNCQNWHIMFVASYQERFFFASIENILEGFMCRFILLSKLRCTLTQKRTFLTWFAGSLHLYADEYFLKSDETRFKNMLAKLFEGLILNGLLTNSEFKNFYKMLIKRNEEMLSVLNGGYYSQISLINRNDDEKDGEDNSNSNKNINNGYQVSIQTQNQCYFPNLDLLYPLTLKNICRLAIKRKMRKFTRIHIEQLSLPNSLKRFIYFDNECESIFKNSELITEKKLG